MAGANNEDAAKQPQAVKEITQKPLQFQLQSAAGRKTKGAAANQQGKREHNFAKPQQRPAKKRSKSEEKLNSQPQGKVSNKLLKRLMLKCDEYNQSKLEDFISFNKIAMAEAFVLHSQHFLQACTKVAYIKTVEVGDPVKAMLVKVADPQQTTLEDVKAIL